MLRYLCAVAWLLFLCFTVTDGAECCKAYTGLDLQDQESQFCPDYCCLALSTKYVQCCSDISLRVPASQRDRECINWINDHIWVPIVGGVVGLIIIIAVCTCCCCCGCCACCRDSKPGTVVIHQPPTAMQATAVSMQNRTTVQNSNPMHVGYDYQ